MTEAAFGGPVFSSRVRLWLEHGGHTIPLAQVGADFIIASEPCDLAPGTRATIVVKVNDDVSRQDYLLVDGLSRDQLESATVVLDEDGLPF